MNSPFLGSQCVGMDPLYSQRPCKLGALVTPFIKTWIWCCAKNWTQVPCSWGFTTGYRGNVYNRNKWWHTKTNGVRCRTMRKKINDDYDRKPDVLFTCQQCEDNVKTVNSDLPEEASLTHATSTHTLTEEPSRFEQFLPAQASNPECPAAAQNFRFSALTFTYDDDGVLVLQAIVVKARQVYIQAALRNFILCLSHYPAIAGHPKNHVCMILWNIISSGHVWQLTHTKHWKTAAHPLKTDLKRSKKLASTLQAAGPLAFLAINMLRLLLEPPLDNYHVIIKTDFTQNEPVQFQVGKLHQWNLQLYSSEVW